MSVHVVYIRRLSSGSIQMDRVEERAVFKYLNLKEMTPTQNHQDLVDTSGESAV